MCGVAGFFHVKSEPVSQETLARAVHILQHRGPDAAGTWRNSEASLGMAHTRLAIVDLSDAGEQPMHSRSGRCVLVYNGELYNHNELAQTHQLALKSRSDSEVVLELLERHGPAMLPNLDGMFAFAQWYAHDRRLLLAVDPVGKKPLYTYWDGRVFAFASEIKALAAWTEARFDVDAEKILEFMAFGYVPSPATVYQFIRKLPAGHFQWVDSAGPKAPKAYWDLPLGQVDPRYTLASAAEELRPLLRRAVRKRLMGDVPVASLLSGGLDSSVVTWEAAQATSHLHTFNASFGAAGFDESPHAQQTAHRIGTQHHTLIVEPSVEFATDCVRHFDEPFADSSALALGALAQETARFVKVALTGDGADELFGGYQRFRAALWSPHFDAALSWLPRVPNWFAARSRAGLLQRWQKGVGHTRLEKLVIWHDFFSEREFHEWLGLRAARAYQALKDFEQRTQGLTPAEQIFYFNFKSYLFDDLLPKADRMSMRFGLELRSPFLDKHVIDFACRLPASLKLSSRQGKLVLREAYRAALGKSVVERRKRGFAYPLQLLNPEPGSSVRNLFPQMDLQRSGPGDLSRKYLLWNLEQWLKLKEEHYGQRPVQHSDLMAALGTQPAAARA